MTEPVTVRATINRIRWAENARVIAEARITDANGSPQLRVGSMVSILGSMQDPTVGQEYELTGPLSPNFRFGGLKLDFQTYVTILPTTNDGIVRYLARTAKHVGPATAAALVTRYADRTLSVLRNEPETVIADGLPAGLTAAKLETIQTDLIANEKTEAAAVEVATILGGVLPPATTAKAIAKWGSNAPAIIRENPFRLTELRGVAFLSADAIFGRLGGDPNHSVRHAAALLHALAEKAGQEGHTAVSITDAIAASSRLVGTLRADTIADSCAAGTSTTENPIPAATRSLNGTTISLTKYAKAESDFWGKLQSLQAAATGAKLPSWKLAISHDSLTPEQILAVNTFAAHRLFILTGAPGTGKTYTIARIVGAARNAGLRIALCAPTGKASKQMAAALSAAGIPMPARTIHSLLEPDYDENTDTFAFGRNASNPLEEQLVIIDEFSMVDAVLAARLFSAITVETSVVIVGDHYQLPSVGAGAVLRDILAADTPAFELTMIQRNAGTIVKACHAIKNGRTPVPDSALDLAAGHNWRHIELSEPTDICAAICTIVADKLTDFGVAAREAQVMSPVNEKGPLSCAALNADLKGALNPAEPEGKLTFTAGDRVVRLQNATVKGWNSAPGEGNTDRIHMTDIFIVNGDIGHVLAIAPKHITVHFTAPDRIAVLPRFEHRLKLAYCLTVHKMQGSEVSVVILPISSSLARIPMVTREWLYTAFSRAKLFLVTVGQLHALSPIIARKGSLRRKTALQQIITHDQEAAV